MKNFALLSIILVLCSLSCEKGELETNPIFSNYANVAQSTTGSIDLEKMYDKKSNLKRQFGKALVKAMQESRVLREIIRKEALKRINKDTDVLYGMIKDEALENGLTVESLILKHLTDKKTIRELLADFPTITIFIPELPNNSFSAETWDVANVTPRVAIRLHNTNATPIIDLNGEEQILGAEYIPGFPVIVIKENERIIAESEKSKGYDKIKTQAFSNKKGEKFRFLFDEYDGLKKSKAREGVSPQFDTRVIEAYDICQNTDNWHRDYVYYGISDNSPRGTIDYNYKEYIKSFTLMGDGLSAFNRIADQTEDLTIDNNTYTPSTPWKDGQFDFNVIALINKKDGTSLTLRKGIPINPNLLFTVNYVQDHWLFGWVYRVDNIQLKTAYLDQGIELFTWDLSYMATQIKLSFEEVDQSQLITSTVVLNTEAANNFEYNLQGVAQKVGQKFGGTVKANVSNTFYVSTNFASDPLGDVLINFGQPIITNRYGLGPLFNYSTNESSTGYCSVSIEPRTTF